MRIPRGSTWLLAVVLLFCAGCSAPPVSPESDPGGRASVSPKSDPGGRARVSVSPDPGTGVQVLAKADGWRAPLGPSFWSLYGVVEVAYHEAAVAQAWAQNVPADLVRRSGDPTLPGLYGDLADIEFDREALVVYSSGQSSSCPGWLTGLEVTELGTVLITTTARGTWFTTVQGKRMGICYADYSGYRMVLSVDRDLLPPISALPTTRVLIDGERLGGGGLVTTDPAQAADPPQRQRPASITGADLLAFLEHVFDDGRGRAP